MTEFEPKIVGFLCNWCSYAGADLAGVSRFQYPTNLRVVRVMCSGRVAPEAVVKALYYGADGVLILGCHIGDCHYLTGNHQAIKRVAVIVFNKVRPSPSSIDASAPCFRRERRRNTIRITTCTYEQMAV